MIITVIALVTWLTLRWGGAVSWFLVGTVYSAEYSEPKFRMLTTGMLPGQVQRVIGQPIGKTPWGERTENWQYSVRGGPMWWHRRWVIFTDGKVSAVVSDIFD